MLALVETPEADRPPEGNLTRLEEKFGWIRDYRQALHDWADLDAVKERVLTEVRIHGYHRGAATQLRRRQRA